MILPSFPATRISLIIILATQIGGCQATKDLAGNLSPSVASRTQPLIHALPKDYKPSLVAIGKERDVNDYRVKGEGLVPIPVLRKYLNDLLAQIKKETGILNLPGTVYVTSNEGLDGLATADGNIFLGIGFLKNLETEDQVVAILAHELAHIIYGHHDSDMIGKLQKQLQQAAQIGAQAQANFSAGNNGNAVIGKNPAKYLQQMQLLIEVTDVALLPAWSRRQEDEADALSIDLTTRMGYSYSRGMKSMLELLSSEEERVDKKRAQQNALLQAQFEKDLKETGNFKLDKLFENIWGSMKSQISSKHDAAGTRIANTSEYYEKFYLDSSYKTRVHKTEWTQVMKNRSVAQTIENYKLAYDADDLRIAGRSDKALPLAKKAASGITSDHPFPLRVLADTQLAMGNQKGFSETSAKSARASEPSWKLIRVKAQQDLAFGKKQQARETMEKGFQHFQEPPSLRPDMISFYVSIGDKNAADKMKTECAFISPEKRDSCFSAGK